MTTRNSLHPSTAYARRKLTRGCWRRGFMSAWLFSTLVVGGSLTIAPSTHAQEVAQSATAKDPAAGTDGLAGDQTAVATELLEQAGAETYPPVKPFGEAPTPEVGLDQPSVNGEGESTYLTDAGDVAPDGTTSLDDERCGAGYGRIDPAYEEEWWRIDASAGETLVLKAIRTSGNLDGWLSLVNPNGQEVAYDDDSAGNANPMIRYPITITGSYRIRVSSYRGASTGDYRLEVCWSTQSTTTTCPASQYTAQYFNNMSLAGSPAVTRCENWPIDHDWSGGRPVEGVGDNNFSVRWTGRAYIEDGTYRFIARADDGVRVWVGGQLIVDAWHDQGPTEYVREMRVSGGTYDIRVDYFENGGGAVAQFRWERGSTTPNCQGTWINIGDGPTGYVGSGGRQSYCFRGDGGRWVSIRAANIGGGLDPMVRLNLPNGDFVENDDAFGYGTNAMLAWQLPQSGVYQLDVSGYGGTAGDFRMHLGLNRKATVADANSNCGLDEGDRWLVQHFFGEASYNDERLHADINLDGVVNTNDYAYVLSHWGRGCQ